MYLGILEADIVKQAERKYKNKKIVPQKNEKTSRNQALVQKSHQRNKHPSSLLCKGPFLKGKRE